MDTLPPEKQDSSLDKKQGFRGLVFVVIAVLILVIVGYFAFTGNKGSDTQETSVATTTSSVETDSWKTYRNEELKFKFQYPADWLLESEKYQEDTYISLKSPETQALFKARPGIDGNADYWITISPASGLDTWFTSAFADRQRNNPELMPAKASTTVADLPAIEIFDPVTEGGCSSNYTAVYFDSHIYKLHAYCNNPSIKTIHSSFKFTPTIITEWKTYKSVPYGFELRYPPTWVAVSGSGLLSLEKRFLPSANTNPATMDGFCKLGFYAFDDKLKNETIRDWLYRTVAEGGNPAPINLTSITFGSRTGLHEVSGKIGLMNSVHLPLSDTSVLSINLLCGDDVLKSGESEFNQILSTLKFTQ